MKEVLKPQIQVRVIKNELHYEAKNKHRVHVESDLVPTQSKRNREHEEGKTKQQNRPVKKANKQHRIKVFQYKTVPGAWAKVIKLTDSDKVNVKVAQIKQI
ncbi:hypothetical protein PA598K_05440 [Paenibacillus sp. 598K]|nr:hypothetical protein PA598K_05440 [Paenibacillus sp. 598K]